MLHIWTNATRPFEEKEKEMSEVTKSTDDTSGLDALGKGSTTYSSSGPSVDILERFPNKGLLDDYLITIYHPEFTSNCPKTGQPDFGEIAIDYIPGQWCVETKSLKLYLVSYRSHASFMETIVNDIKDHLVDKLEPKYLRVSGRFNPRGGTYLTPTAMYISAGLDRHDLLVLLNLLGRK